MFGVESRTDLESTLTADDLDNEEIRTRNRSLRNWERSEDNKRLLRHAPELYDDTRSLYPNRDGVSGASVPLSQ